jgi:hypothetical protein
MSTCVPCGWKNITTPLAENEGLHLHYTVDGVPHALAYCAEHYREAQRMLNSVGSSRWFTLIDARLNGASTCHSCLGTSRRWFCTDCGRAQQSITCRCGSTRFHYVECANCEHDWPLPGYVVLIDPETGEPLPGYEMED